MKTARERAAHRRRVARRAAWRLLERYCATRSYGRDGFALCRVTDAHAAIAAAFLAGHDYRRGLERRAADAPQHGGA